MVMDRISLWSGLGLASAACLTIIALRRRPQQERTRRVWSRVLRVATCPQQNTLTRWASRMMDYSSGIVPLPLNSFPSIDATWEAAERVVEWSGTWKARGRARYCWLPLGSLGRSDLWQRLGEVVYQTMNDDEISTHPSRSPTLDRKELVEIDGLLERLQRLCERALTYEIGIVLWIPYDESPGTYGQAYLARQMMRFLNHRTTTVYTGFHGRGGVSERYRLTSEQAIAEQDGYALGVVLMGVRGSRRWRRRQKGGDETGAWLRDAVLDVAPTTEGASLIVCTNKTSDVSSIYETLRHTELRPWFVVSPQMPSGNQVAFSLGRQARRVEPLKREGMVYTASAARIWGALVGARTSSSSRFHNSLP